MKTFLRFFIVYISWVSFVFAHFPDEIPFCDKKGASYYLRPFHLIEKQEAIQGLVELFKDETVHRYYEKGRAKTYEECESTYNRVAPRFENWQRDQVGWVGIFNSNKKFIGFIGSFLEKAEEPFDSEKTFAIQFCAALSADYQRHGIITRATFEYFLCLSHEMDPAVWSQIDGIKGTIHPNNMASLGLMSSFYSKAVDSTIFIPAYYKDPNIINPEKAERQNMFIPLNAMMEKAWDYQRAKK